MKRATKRLAVLVLVVLHEQVRCGDSGDVLRLAQRFNTILDYLAIRTPSKPDSVVSPVLDCMAIGTNLARCS